MIRTFQGVSMNKLFRILTAVFAVIALSGTAFAQSAASGSIEGIVTDPSGASGDRIACGVVTLR